MKTIITIVGINAQGKKVEQPYPLEVESPAHIPAHAAAVLQQLCGVAGVVGKDPDFPNRVVLLPAAACTEIYVDIPNIVLTDALEGQSILHP